VADHSFCARFSEISTERNTRSLARIKIFLRTLNIAKSIDCRPSSSVAEALEVFSLGFWLAHGTPAMCRSSIRITVEAYALFRYRASTVPNDLLHHWDS
jgi:hypothetical protein